MNRIEYNDVGCVDMYTKYDNKQKPKYVNF